MLLIDFFLGVAVLTAAVNSLKHVHIKFLSPQE